MATVTEVLKAATDSVTLIDGVKAGSFDTTGMTQAEINEMVQRNVDHLSTILEYAPVDSPNVKGSSADKSSYTGAITTGNKYIKDNS